MAEQETEGARKPKNILRRCHWDHGNGWEAKKEGSEWQK